MNRRPPRATQSRSSAASDVYKRQDGEPAPGRVAHDHDRAGVDAVVEQPPVGDERIVEGRREPMTGRQPVGDGKGAAPEHPGEPLSLIHISEPTRPY